MIGGGGVGVGHGDNRGVGFQSSTNNKTQNIHQQLCWLCVNKLLIYFFKRTILRSSNGQTGVLILET